MYKRVQVRVKVKGDGLTWDSRSPVAEFIVEELELSPGEMKWIHPMSGKTLIEKATDIGRCYGQCEEIRWNWKGSLQGHYISIIPI